MAPEIKINKEMELLCRTAETDGWQKAFFAYTLQKVKNQEKSPEDQRCADWKFLTDFNNQSDILLFGCGLGTIPVSLSLSVRSVLVCDCDRSSLRFINIRKKEQGLDNLFPLYIKNIENCPFKKKSFDGITFLQNSLCHNDKPVSFTDMVKTASGFLKDTGTLVLMVDNAFSFTRLLGKTTEKASQSLQTISGYKKTLIREGFTDIRFYAPLPGHGNVPMFYVPLSDHGGTRYFIENIFGFFDMVSPEVKKSYAVEYATAKIAVFIARMIQLTWLMKYFVPGYTIIARKQASSI
jgi:SAM-dependent methyltransferase